MPTILPFPTAPRRRRSAAALPLISAVIEPFPRVLDARLIAGIAAEMRAQSCDEQAEAVLVAHLELEAMRLAGLGIADDEIERVCHKFAVAAWAAALHSHHTDQGAAS